MLLALLSKGHLLFHLYILVFCMHSYIYDNLVLVACPLKTVFGSSSSLSFICCSRALASITSFSASPFLPGSLARQVASANLRTGSSISSGVIGSSVSSTSLTGRRL